MLYPKTGENTLDPGLFRNPSCEYRGTPFWAWNCELNQADLNEEIDAMKQMGLGGFHMHTRVGMSTTYLGSEFMQFVKGCVEKAKQNDMLAWLYDEDKWPSGFAGGYVTKDIENRIKYLLLSRNPHRAEQVAKGEVAFRPRKSVLLASYQVELSDSGYLKSYRRLAEGETAPDAWYAYLEYAPDAPWFNNQSYADTLSKTAIEKFVEVTHERYKQAIGEEFGKRVPAIFTDEPELCIPREPGTKEYLSFAADTGDLAIVFTTDFADSFRAAYGMDIMQKLPELFWELPDSQVSQARYCYHDHLSERFASAFADTIGSWCRRNNILMTGHLMAENTLASQTSAVGECMRHYRGFGLPGIDMLCNRVELTTAKQAQSAAHQYGCPGVMSELYGVTNWDFDFRGHKLHGDWQAALGVTVRVHHLYWVSMGGEAKRDYPAAIGHQSPWYREYPYIEDHFARVNTAMTRGKPAVKIGVIHPVESYWLYAGCREQTAGTCAELEQHFTEITEWLLYGLTDFDYICESQLPKLYDVAKPGFSVGEMSYEAVIVPACKTLRGTTLAALRDYASRGGKVIFAGELPRFVDAKPCDCAREFAQTCQNVSWSQSAILSALEPFRTLDIVKADGSRADNLIHSLRDDGGIRRLFISHVRTPENPDVCRREDYRIRIRGEFAPTQYNTLTGEISPLPAVYRAGVTEIAWSCYEQSSLLLALEPGRSSLPAEKPAAAPTQLGELDARVPVSLSEPNVLVLDMPQYALDGEDWRPAEEILRLDNLVRQRLGFPLRCSAWAQPWVDPDRTPPQHELALRFVISSEIEADNVSLALESLEYTSIRFNGGDIEPKPNGWFTDKAIRTVPLGKLHKGENELVLRIRYGAKVMVEWCYLLGDFGVRVDGRFATVTAPVRSLAFGDWTTQGLPFYAGNVVYHCTVEGGSPLTLEVPQFRSPLVAVDVDGTRRGVVAIAPYQVRLDGLSAGTHALTLTAFGNRINAFGTLHNCDNATTWFGPDSWRSTGARWSYEYRLRESGILIAPRLWREQ